MLDPRLLHGVVLGPRTLSRYLLSPLVLSLNPIGRGALLSYAPGCYMMLSCCGDVFNKLWWPLYTQSISLERRTTHIHPHSIFPPGHIIYYPGLPPPRPALGNKINQGGPRKLQHRQPQALVRPVQKNFKPVSRFAMYVEHN